MCGAFDINKSLGEISVISTNKWHHHWEGERESEGGGARPWQPLSRALRFCFWAPPRGVWLDICWIALQRRSRTWVCRSADWAKAARGRWWREWMANGKNAFQCVYPLSAEPKRKNPRLKREHPQWEQQGSSPHSTKISNIQGLKNTSRRSHHGKCYNLCPLKC